MNVTIINPYYAMKSPSLILLQKHLLFLLSTSLSQNCCNLSSFLLWIKSSSLYKMCNILCIKNYIKIVCKQLYVSNKCFIYIICLHCILYFLHVYQITVVYYSVPFFFVQLLQFLNFRQTSYSLQITVLFCSVPPSTNPLVEGPYNVDSYKEDLTTVFFITCVMLSPLLHDCLIVAITKKLLCLYYKAYICNTCIT